MKNDIIILEWVENGKRYKKEIKKKTLLENLYTLMSEFKEDCQALVILVKLIPDLTYIEINKDININKDVPTIYCKTTKGEKLIDILRHHKVIWFLLDEICKD